MKRVNIHIVLTLVIFFSLFIGKDMGWSQNIGINTTGNPAVPSAILDIDASPGNNKGLLIPRLTAAQRNSIASPALGLMIYNTDCKTLNLYDGTQWTDANGSPASPGTPTAIVGTAITETSFSANWNSVSGATAYYLDVDDNSDFSSPLVGYDNQNVGAVTTYSVTGLTCGTTYYYQVRAANSCESGSSSNSITVSTTACCTPDSWTQKLDYGGTKRLYAAGFSIGTNGYIGTGDDPVANQADFWKWDQTNNTWTQMAIFPGGSREQAVGITINGKGYMGLGRNGGTKYADWYEYDPVGNSWTSKAPFPGTARFKAVGFTVGSYGYVGTGDDGVKKKDFYRYDPSGDSWSGILDLTGAARYAAVAFSIGTKGYVGTGYGTGELSDFWEYDPGGNSWTSKATVPGGTRQFAAGFSIGTKGYLGTGQSAGFLSDFYEYDPAGDSWTAKAAFGGGVWGYAVGFSIGAKGYIGTGYNGPDRQKGFYEYCP